jgi:hypothetical protein
MACNSSLIKTNEQIFEILDRMTEPENRLAFVAPSVILKHSLLQHYQSGSPSIFEAVENISPLYLGFSSMAGMKKIVSTTASRLRDSGILSYLVNNIHPKSDLDSTPQPIGPQVLTMRHLEAGFVICCGLLALSAAALAIECAIEPTKKLFKSMFARKQ